MGDGNFIEVVCGRKLERREGIVLFCADVDFYIVVG